MLYRNNTDTLVVINDLNIKFQRKGKYGDHVNLSNFASAQTIKDSRDLQIALRKGWIVAAIPTTAKASAANKRNLSGRTGLQQSKEDKIVGQVNFAVYQKQNAPKKEEGAVVYAHADKKVLTIDKAKPKEKKKEEPKETSFTAEASVETTVEQSFQADVSVEAVAEQSFQADTLVAAAQNSVTVAAEVAAEAALSEQAQIAERPQLVIDKTYCTYVNPKKQKQCRWRPLPESEFCKMHERE